jgi:hypothetical protein
LVCGTLSRPESGSKITERDSGSNREWIEKTRQTLREEISERAGIPHRRW